MSKPQKTVFGSLDNGAVFEFSGDLFIKMKQIDESGWEWNALRLYGKRAFCAEEFAGSDVVQLHCELTVELHELMGRHG